VLIIAWETIPTNMLDKKVAAAGIELIESKPESSPSESKTCNLVAGVGIEPTT